MYHYLYKITNDFDNCFYYGVHSTKNLEDNYMGSGLRLWNAYRAHGIEHFSKEILEFFETREAVLLREKEIVTIELVKDPNCYNLVLGGGNCEPTGCVTARFKGTEKWLTIPCEEYWENKDLYETSGSGKVLCKEKSTGEFKLVDSEEYRLNRKLYVHQYEGKILSVDKDGNKLFAEKDDPRFETGEIKNYWEGRKHSDETIQNMKNAYAKTQHQKGEKNSQYGTCWITKDQKSIRIKKTELNDWLEKGWSEGRIVQNKEKIVSANQDKIWINKDGKTKMIYKSEAKKYKDEGWLYGRNTTRTRIDKKKNLNIEFWNNL